MKYLLILILSLGVSLVTIPLLARMAPRLGLIDIPDERKVHALPIPRVGGLGVLLGVLLTTTFWVAEFDRIVVSYLWGAGILLIFGVLDDRSSLPPKLKFLGQIVAVLPMVLYAGLYVYRFPFLTGYMLPAVIGIPFTIVATAGVINAVNTSDGLDGLAGGEVMITLFGISALAFAAGGDVLLIIAAAAMGGLTGFLRYNTRPARIFMGDTGSQYLGFAVAFLVVVLTQDLNPKLRPAIVLLLLGLPVVDLIVVAIRRLSKGVSPFAPDKDHLHHRIMNLGFTHQRTVVIVYSLQMLMVASGVALRNQADWVHVLVYVVLCSAIFGMVSIAERQGWHSSQAPSLSKLLALAADSNGGQAKMLVWAPRKFLEIAIPLYLIVAVTISDPLPKEFVVLGVITAMMIILQYRLPDGPALIVRRMAIYGVAVACAYFLSYYTDIGQLLPRRIEQAYLTALGFALAMAIKLSPRRRKEEFLTTPLDYLVGMVLIVVLASSDYLPMDRANAGLIVRIIVLLYACELMIFERRRGFDLFGIGCFLAALAITYRAI